MTNSRPAFLHRDHIDPRYGNDHVRHAGIHEMNGGILAFELEFHIEPQAGRLAHWEPHFVALEGRANDSGRSLKRNRAVGTGHPGCKSSEAARAVPAHFSFAPVTVVITHPEVGSVGG